MEYLLLAFSVVLATAKSSVYNLYAKRAAPDTRGVFRFNAVAYGVAMLVSLISLLCDSGGGISLPTVLCAIAYAATVFSLQSLSVVAMTVGPMSLTSLAVLYGMIIPALAGPIFWHEPFGLLQGIGLAVTVVSLWLLRDSNSADKAASKRWVVLAVICFVLSGMAGIFEKIHQSTEGREERGAFIFLSCAIMLVFSIVGSLAWPKRAEAPTTTAKPLLLFGALSGVIVGLYSRVNLTLAGTLDALIYYPVANGGALILTVAVSLVAFKERIAGRRLVGFIMALAAVLMLSIPV